MRFTVFTPTYNRGTLLWDLYASLCRQTFRDFEWVIVDDGSVDNTEKIIHEMKKRDNFFEIVYLKVQNGGKHRAWNKGIDLARGELFFGCDSDDYLTDDALEVTDKMERSIAIEEKKNYAGVCGLKGYKDFNVVGTTFSSEDYRDMTHLERVKNNVHGDKSEVIYTEIWKKYKYHEFAGERFITEATALNRMAADGLKMRYFNSVIKIIEYLPDGLSANPNEQFVKNPQGWGLYLYQLIKYKQLTGMKKAYKLWEYYDCCIRTMDVKQIADNLNMNVFSLQVNVLLERVNKKIRKS